MAEKQIMLNGEEGNMSLEHIRVASELYDKKPMVTDEEGLQVPFPVLPGEGVVFLGKTDGGTIALSNFRLFIRFKESFINIPLGLIESVEYRDIFFINIFCKDAHSFRCTFATNEICLEWYKRLLGAIQPATKLQDVFAFAFRAWCRDPGGDSQLTGMEHGTAYQLCTADDMGGGYSFSREVERMGFDLKKAWKICSINEDYSVCDSYPVEHLVPTDMKEEELRSVCSFRASHRFPSIVWRDSASGAVIARSSQPEVGWFSWRSKEDEKLLRSISASCAINSGHNLPVRCHYTQNGNGVVENDVDTTGKKMLIIDARSYTAAWANRAKGGGCECTEYYPNCEIQFMSLANIHTVRKSFYAVRALCALGSDNPSWLTSVENTKWLSHISLLMRSALLVVNAISKEGRPVLVHCSDGWDRTPQIVALAELMLDPFYRTIQGFRILIEREWLAFGHKFADRCGSGPASDDVNERSPIFLQWLDCVHQLQLQFPCAFQFNEAFLVKLAHHVYSMLFGTFLCNTIHDREEGKAAEQTNTVWSMLLEDNRQFVNLLHKANSHRTLRPSCHMRHVELWQAVYMSETAPTAVVEPFDDVTDVLDGTSPEQAPLAKTRSCEDLSTVMDKAEESKVRRLSDPHIVTDTNSLIQSTDSLGSLEKKDNRTVERCGDDVIATRVSSETLTELNGVVGGQEGDSQCDSDKTIEMSGEEDGSQYGIAKIDSPHANSAQDIQQLHSQHNGLSAEVNGSTDTLTEDLDIMDRTNTSKPVTSSQDNVDETPRTMQNGHSAHDDSSINNTVLRNGSSESCQNSTFNLDAVLSKLSIDANCLLKEGVELRGSVPSVSRGSSSGREDNVECNGSYHSRTPNSTGPPTPGTDLKSNPWFMRQQSSLGRHLDCDGLTTFVDPVQNRLARIENDYEHKLQELKQQLCVAKAVIYQYTAGVNGTGKTAENIDDMLSVESADSGEHGSLGGGSTAASDVSWEQVEERDAPMTLWVPDHAVTHCAGCDQMFWVVRRRHHCRNCGRVFCGECTKYYRPLPDQHLPNPQRVCIHCYHAVSASLVAIMADGAIMANGALLATNGCLETSTQEDGSVASC